MTDIRIKRAGALSELGAAAVRGAKAFGRGTASGAADLVHTSPAPAGLSGKSEAAWHAGSLVPIALIAAAATYAVNKTVRPAPDAKTKMYRDYLKLPEVQASLKELERKGYKGGSIGLDPDKAVPGYLR